jgi:hypothetical protein
MLSVPYAAKQPVHKKKTGAKAVKNHVQGAWSLPGRHRLLHKIKAVHLRGINIDVPFSFSEPLATPERTTAKGRGFTETMQLS